MRERRTVGDRLERQVLAGCVFLRGVGRRLALVARLPVAEKAHAVGGQFEAGARAAVTIGPGGRIDLADDQISALMEMIAALQNAVVALQAHSTSDGYDVGNLPGNVPVNNGTLNTGLNAEKLGGKTVDEVLLGGAVVTGKTATGEYLTVTLNGVVRYIPVFA